MKFGILSKPTEVGVQVTVQNLGRFRNESHWLKTNPDSRMRPSLKNKIKKCRARCGGMCL